MNSNKIRMITRTGILLALTIVFQMLGRYLVPYLGQYNNFVVGPLVNASLLIAAATVGIWGASAIAVLAPIGAMLTGASMPVPFVPIVAVGNLIIVISFYMLRKHKVAGIAVGAVLKTGFLTAAVMTFVGIMNMPDKKESALMFSFTWPQLVTAIVGGIIALTVIKALEKSIEIQG